MRAELASTKAKLEEDNVHVERTSLSLPEEWGRVARAEDEWGGGIDRTSDSVDEEQVRGPWGDSHVSAFGNQ